MIRSNALPFLAVLTFATACTGARTHTAESQTTASAAERRGLATRYLAIATVGNRGLERAFDKLDGVDHHLVAARADLHDAAATEHRFDRSLLTIVFPSAIETTARDLVSANEARANLTAEAAASTSLQQLRRYDPQLATANDAVIQQVKILRTQLGLPPPEAG